MRCWAEESDEPCLGAIILEKHLKHRATEQLIKNKEKFRLKPEKVTHQFGYACC